MNDNLADKYNMTDEDALLVRLLKTCYDYRSQREAVPVVSEYTHNVVAECPRCRETVAYFNDLGAEETPSGTWRRIALIGGRYGFCAACGQAYFVRSDTNRVLDLTGAFDD